MLSLFFGLAAALSWGVHDVCVRFVAARAGIALAFLTVLATGLLVVAPVALLLGVGRRTVAQRCWPRPPLVWPMRRVATAFTAPSPSDRRGWSPR